MKQAIRREVCRQHPLYLLVYLRRNPINYKRQSNKGFEGSFCSTVSFIYPIFHAHLLFSKMCMCVCVCVCDILSRILRISDLQLHHRRRIDSFSILWLVKVSRFVFFLRWNTCKITLPFSFPPVAIFARSGCWRIDRRYAELKEMGDIIRLRLICKEWQDADTYDVSLPAVDGSAGGMISYGSFSPSCCCSCCLPQINIPILVFFRWT